ncbi:MAG: hypothetical protein ACOZAA_01240 [Pseudomonadota bacterium]
MVDAKKAPYPELTSGSLVMYDYLWRWQHESGENEGRKPRECVIAIRTMVLESDTIFILPITATPPAPERQSFELPELEVRRIGRGQVQRLWVIIDELNVDLVERSFVLRPGCKVGDLSRPVYEALLKRLRALGGAVVHINRAE